MLKDAAYAKSLGSRLLMTVYKGIAPGEERKALPSLDINTKRLADGLLQLAFSLSQQVSARLNTIRWNWNYPWWAAVNWQKITVFQNWQWMYWHNETRFKHCKNMNSFPMYSLLKNVFRSLRQLKTHWVWCSSLVFHCSLPAVVCCCFSAEWAAGGLVVEHHHALCADIWKP